MVEHAIYRKYLRERKKEIYGLQKLETESRVALGRIEQSIMNTYITVEIVG
jgi:hypothetical protein